MNLDLSHLNAKLILPAPYGSIEFWLVGAGGTGSFMAMNLARLVFELKNLGRPPARIVIVDPDRVESGNIPRSNFCFAEVGLNKAETLAGRIARAWGIEAGFVKEGFRPELLLESAKADSRRAQVSDSNKLTVLIGCVDNHLARRQLHETLKFHSERGMSYGSNLPRVWWIDGGNGRDTGQVLMGNCLNEQKICDSARALPILSHLPAPSLQHPDLLEPEGGEKPVRSISSSRTTGDRHTTCAERIRLGEQSLNINSRVAIEMSEMLTALLLTNSLKRFASYFDLETGTSRSSFATPEKIEHSIKSAAKISDVSKKRKPARTGK